MARSTVTKKPAVATKPKPRAPGARAAPKAPARNAPKATAGKAAPNKAPPTKSAARKSASPKAAAARAAATKSAPAKTSANRAVAAKTSANRAGAAKTSADRAAPKKPVAARPSPPTDAASHDPAAIAPDAASQVARTGAVHDRARYLRDGERFGAATLALHSLPPLHVPSGQIVTCDPFLVDGPTLARKVRPGAYPVTVAVATFPTGPNEKDKGDQRVAAAFVRFTDHAITTWVPADFAGATPDDATPGDAREPAYVVDAGTGAFLDARAHAAIVAEPPHWPTPSYTALEQQLLAEHYVHTWSWAAYQPDPRSPGNCIAFMSGWGDGAYTSYWGLDRRGHPAVLLTDFEVFTHEDWS